MGSIPSNSGSYITVGENIHTTRVLLRKGKRIAVEDGVEVILYETADGSPRHLPVPDFVKSTQDYDEGRVKHVKIALAAAMQGSGAEAENGLDYLRALAHQQERAGIVTLTGRTRKEPCQLFFKPPRSHFPRRRMRRFATA